MVKSLRETETVTGKMFHTNHRNVPLFSCRGKAHDMGTF